MWPWAGVGGYSVSPREAAQGCNLDLGRSEACQRPKDLLSEDPLSSSRQAAFSKSDSTIFFSPQALLESYHSPVNIKRLNQCPLPFKLGRSCGFLDE